MMGSGRLSTADCRLPTDKMLLTFTNEPRVNQLINVPRLQLASLSHAHSSLWWGVKRWLYLGYWKMKSTS